jgi:hypothetical protein
MMNYFKSLLLSAVILASGQAIAGTVVLSENGNMSGYLPSCGGTAVLSRTYGGLTLHINRARDCSNLVVDGFTHKLDGNPNNYWGAVQLRSNGNAHIEIRSNSGAHHDTIIVRASYNPPTGGANVYLDTRSNRWGRLPTCGGTVEVNTMGNQVNLVFRDVENCSNFDILSNDGRSISYPNQKLGGRDGARAGSFTLPKRVVDFGHNGVRVELRSNSRKTNDIVYVKFYAW